MEKNQLKKGIVLNYINIGLGNLIPIFYTPIMLALLGQSEYGLYKLSSSVTSYLSLISLGIGSAVTRYLIKFRIEQGQEGEEKIMGLFMVVFQIIAIAAFIIGMILAFNLNVFYENSLSSEQIFRMRILVILMVINMSMTFSVSPYVSVVNAHEKFVFLQCMNIISTCAGPLINLVVLYLGFASIGMVTSTLALGIVVNIAYLVYVRKSLGIRAKYKNLPTDQLKEILVFSFWIFVANIVGQLYNATDTVMIGAVPALATMGVAVYNVGGMFNQIVFSLATGVSALLTPKVNKMVFEGASNKELTDLAIKVGRIQCYIISLIVTGFIVFGRQFIHFYVGAGYEEAYWVAIFMMIPNMIPLVQSVCLSVVVAKNQHRFRSIVYLCIAILNVAGTWVLMQTMGIVGAALMTGIALIIGTGFVMNWYYLKKTGLEIGRFWRQVSKLYIAPIIMCIIALIISRYIDFYNFSNMILGILVYIVIFFIAEWIFVMNPYEKQLVCTPISKIFKNRKARDDE